MGVEAAVIFDPALALEFEYRRKRGAHLFSKHRYLSAQMEAYLEGDLWLTLGRRANAARARLEAGLRARGVEVLPGAGANLMFFRATRAEHQRLLGAGANYYTWDGDAAEGPAEESITARLVCDWSVSDESVETFLGLFG